MFEIRFRCASLWPDRGRYAMYAERLSAVASPGRSPINSTTTAGSSSSPMSLDRKSTRLNSSHQIISYAVFCLTPRPPPSTLFPYTTLFRSGRFLRRYPLPVNVRDKISLRVAVARPRSIRHVRRKTFRRSQPRPLADQQHDHGRIEQFADVVRSEEHTSELQSPDHLVCRLLLDTAPPAIYTLSLHDALPIWPLPPALPLASECSR